MPPPAGIFEFLFWGCFMNFQNLHEWSSFFQKKFRINTKIATLLSSIALIEWIFFCMVVTYLSRSDFHRAFVSLSNLLQSISMGHKVAIVNDRGDVRGYLTLCVQPATGETSPWSGADADVIGFFRADIAARDDDVPDFIPGVRQSAKIRFSESDVTIEKPFDAPPSLVINWRFFLCWVLLPKVLLVV